MSFVEDTMRILTNICSDDLQESKTFYVNLLDFQVKCDSDWYVQLCLPTDPETEFGIIQRDHELVPEAYQNAPNGMYVTFVVVEMMLLMSEPWIWVFLLFGNPGMSFMVSGGFWLQIRVVV